MQKVPRWLKALVPTVLIILIVGDFLFYKSYPPFADCGEEDTHFTRNITRFGNDSPGTYSDTDTVLINAKYRCSVIGSYEKNYGPFSPNFILKYDPNIAIFSCSKPAELSGQVNLLYGGDNKPIERKFEKPVFYARAFAIEPEGDSDNWRRSHEHGGGSRSVRFEVSCHKVSLGITELAEKVVELLR